MLIRYHYKSEVNRNHLSVWSWPVSLTSCSCKDPTGFHHRFSVCTSSKSYCGICAFFMYKLKCHIIYKAKISYTLSGRKVKSCYHIYFILFGQLDPPTLPLVLRLQHLFISEVFCLFCYFGYITSMYTHTCYRTKVIFSGAEELILPSVVQLFFSLRRVFAV